MPVIKLAKSAEDIGRCFPVMKQLRPHVVREAFVPRVTRQMGEGYQLAYVEDEGAVRAVAGYRVSECLSSGRFLYVDDLVTDESCRSRGFGDQLFDWLVAQARAQGCEVLSLDSGVQRHEAHRFYFRKRMHISGHHFAVALT